MPITACPAYSPFRFLPPISFAIVMSTGTLACATLTQADFLPFLKLPALVLCWLNFAIFALLCPYALISWFLNKGEINRACQTPGEIALFSTSGIALLVIAHQCLFFELGFLPAFLFWICGAIVSFGLNFWILFKAFTGRHGQEQITPVFFIPVVSLAVVPTGGAALMAGLAPTFAQTLELVCLLSLGGAIMLYCGLFGLLLARHIFLEPMPDPLAPTYWIHLAPLGWISISVIALGHIMAPEATQATLRFLCLLAWGGAAWWTVMAALLTIRALIRKGMTFSLAWWSFIFPLGSFALLTKLLAIPFNQEISFAIWLLMAFIWLMAAARTLQLLHKQVWPAQRTA